MAINWKSRRKLNLFSRSRRRLAVVYSLLMFIVFSFLIFLARESLQYAVNTEQARELSEVARDVADTETLLMSHDVVVAEDLGKRDRMFFYVYDTDNDLLNYSRAPKWVEEDVLELIKSGSVPFGDVAVFVQHEDKTKPTVLMMTSAGIQLHGKMVGTVYVGKDISALYKGIKNSTVLLGAIALVALIIAIIIGYILSGKVIKPMEDAYERQRQFAADASHELRTPLSVVMASADLLGNDPSIESPILKQVIDDLKDEVRKMSKLVGDLLTIARSDGNAEGLNISEFDVAETLNQIVRNMRPLAEKKNIAISGVNLDNPVLYHGDEQKVSRLALIFIDNAVKYTPEGGNVTVSLLDTAKKWHIGFSVKDTGIGLAKEDQERIFERFYRVDKARSREMGGNGLGLAIARAIVKSHGGSIAINSELGKGTEFVIELADMGK